MILSDTDIRVRLTEDRIITPAPADKAIQPASVDLRLGGDARLCIEPGQFVLAATLERVRIPTDLVARIEGKSSIGRRGVMVHVTAGFIDPGFEGHITLECFNLSTKRFVLDPGEYVCQLCFHQLTSRCRRPYGALSLGSRYQGQGPGPQEAK